MNNSNTITEQDLLDGTIFTFENGENTLEVFYVPKPKKGKPIFILDFNTEYMSRKTFTAAKKEVDRLINKYKLKLDSLDGSGSE